MFCSNCGKRIPDGSSICPECGLNLAGAAQQAAPMNDVQLAQPIAMENVLNLAESSNQNIDRNAGENGYTQVLDQNVSGYGYTQSLDQNADGNGYQQGTDQNVGGYAYQQGTDQNAGGYGYTQSLDQNAGGYGYQQGIDQNAGGYTYQLNSAQGTGYYEGLNNASPEQQNWNAGQPGQPGSSGGGASLALGICSICIGITGGLAFGIIGAGIGIVLGIVGMIVAINYRKANGGGATGGLVTSIVGLALAALMFFGCVACGAASSGYLSLGCVGGSCGVANENINKTTKYFR